MLRKEDKKGKDELEKRVSSRSFYFQWSKKGAAEGEPVFIIGRPGNTDRLLSNAQIDFHRNHRNPAILNLFNELYQAQFAHFQANPDKQAEMLSQLLSIANGRKVYAGYQLALNDEYLMAKKRDFEEELMKRMSQNKGLYTEYRDLWGKIDEAVNVLNANFTTFFAHQISAFSSPAHLQLAQKLMDYAEQMNLPEGFVGWTMVALASAFYKEQVAAVPYDRRLFLLPHCLKHAEGCPADYDEFGLDCRTCGACSIADFRTRAEDLGYKVLVSEGTPIVLKIIVSGHVDAIVGVACLNVLEKAIDKILLAGIPCMAVPLLSSDCKNTSVDEDWVSQMINLEFQQPQVQTRSYLHLMRAAAAMFEPQELARLAPRSRSQTPLAELNGNGVHGLDPIAGTEAIAHDFLSRGGKHLRPFASLAVYDALTGANGTLPNGAEHVAAFGDAGVVDGQAAGDDRRGRFLGEGAVIAQCYVGQTAEHAAMHQTASVAVFLFGP